MAKNHKFRRLLSFTVFGFTLFTIGVGQTTKLPERETLVFVVRHAEKAATPSEDPPLSDAGRERAKALSHALNKANVRAIFATQYQRTRQTVEPTAQALNIPIIQIDAAKTEVLVGQLLDKHRGGVVLVAGHSNTIPDIIAGLGAAKIPPIAETEFDNLFVVFIPGSGQASVLHLQYGAAD